MSSGRSSAACTRPPVRYRSIPRSTKAAVRRGVVSALAAMIYDLWLLVPGTVTRVCQLNFGAMDHNAMTLRPPDSVWDAPPKIIRKVRILPPLPSSGSPGSLPLRVGFDVVRDRERVLSVLDFRVSSPSVIRFALYFSALHIQNTESLKISVNQPVAPWITLIQPWVCDISPGLSAGAARRIRGLIVSYGLLTCSKSRAAFSMF